MSIQVKAIYENGVFRPLQSVKLPEQQEVVLAIDAHGTDSPDSGDQTLLALTAERWQAFCDALDAAPREIPMLRKLLTEASLFDVSGSSPGKSGPT